MLVCICNSLFFVVPLNLLDLQGLLPIRLTVCPPGTNLSVNAVDRGRVPTLQLTLVRIPVPSFAVEICISNLPWFTKNVVAEL